MAEPKEKLSNLKVLTIEEKGSFFSKKQNKDLKQYQVVLQGVEDQGVVRTGMANEPLPEGVEAGGTVEDLWVYEDSYNGKVTTKFFFPKKKGEGDGGGGYSGGGYNKGGYTPAPKESEEAKIVGVFGRYVADVMIAQPQEVNWDTFSDVVEKVSVAAWGTVKALKNG